MVLLGVVFLCGVLVGFLLFLGVVGLAGRLLWVVVGVVLVCVACVGVWFGLVGGRVGGGVVRVGTLLGGISTLDVMEARGLARGFVLRVYRFHRTPEILSALVRGDVDVAVVPVEMAGRLIEEGVPVVVVGVDMLQNQAVVAGGGFVGGVCGLAGRRVGAVLASGTFHMFKAYMRVVCNVSVVEGGSPRPGVVVAVNLEPGVLLDALRRGEVDAVVVWEPFVSRAIAMGYRVVASFSDLWRMSGVGGEPVMLVYVARRGWVLRHAGLLVRFLEARVRAARLWVSEPGVVESVLEKLYHLSPRVAGILYGRVRVVARHLDDVLASSIRRVWWLAYRGGYLPKPPSSIPGDAVLTWAGLLRLAGGG